MIFVTRNGNPDLVLRYEKFGYGGADTDKYIKALRESPKAYKYRFPFQNLSDAMMFYIKGESFMTVEYFPDLPLFPFILDRRLISTDTAYGIPRVFVDVEFVKPFENIVDFIKRTEVEIAASKDLEKLVKQLMEAECKIKGKPDRSWILNACRRLHDEGFGSNAKF